MTKADLHLQMDAMRSFDEPMPQVGIFWYDPEDKTFFGVCKQELTPKQVEEAAEQGQKYIAYPSSSSSTSSSKGHFGRVAWNINKFIVFVGQWPKPIEQELTTLLEQEFALPYFEFVYDEHWDLGHGWSGDL